MNVPNLSSHPFLNTRPVWLVSALALTIAVVLGMVNLQLYLESSHELVEQLAFRDLLLERHEELSAEVREELAAMDQVQWRGLGSRVSGLNIVLREHAFSWLKMLDDLEAVLPYQVKVVLITPSVSGEGVIIKMSAVARTREAMLELVQNLIDAPCFSNPMISREQWPESNDTVEYLFSVEVEYDADGEAS